MKTQILHAVVWKEKKLYVAKFLEVELASQGKTMQEAKSNLKEALDLYLEDEELSGINFPSIENVTTQTVSIN